ncbi:MAG TPA: alpha/beta fold hydrolase, partial [Candidatus Limnocylindrales bacterium]|nr:alpha/beta fold hydrolase [Candidatus Limnocylindrales bacterium]
MHRLIFLTFVSAAVCALASSPARAADRCDAGAFVMTRQGDVNDVEWVSARGEDVVHHAVSNQAVIIAGTERVAGDGTSRELRDLTYTMVGATPKPRPVKIVPSGAVMWWESWPSTLQHVVRRAERGGRAHTVVPVVEVIGWKRDSAIVDRDFGPTWRVRVGVKRYTVVTDRDGCVASATMPDYAVAIERRSSFDARAYAPWPFFTAPADGAYTAEDVRIPAPAGHVLAGTLTLPAHRAARLPAAVMITGISPHDRDEGPGQLRPFRDVTDALTRAGIAVLRVDDRGVGASTGDRKSSTTLDEANDVQTEIGWLAQRPEIDPKRIAVVGHSEGGLISMIVASRDPRVAAAVMLAAPGFTGQQIFEYQTRIDVERDPNVPVWDREHRIHAILTEPDDSPRDQWFLRSDPIPYARGVRVPALLVQGGNDLHVPPASAVNLARAMEAGGNHDVTVSIIPGVSHTLLYDADGTARGWATLP